MAARSGAAKSKKTAGSGKAFVKKPLAKKKTALTLVKEQVKAVAKKVKSQLVPPPKVASKKELVKTEKTTVKTPALVKSKSSKSQSSSGLAAVASAPRTDGGCHEVACELQASSGGYCRLHYIKNWKKIKRKEMILREGKLNEYVEELVKKYPDKYIEAIRQDLAEDKEFSKVVTELELNESIDEFDSDADAIDNLIDNIRRDMDDDGDAF